MSNITLYGYWRSSAAYRVRIALNYKGLAYQQKSIHLVKNGGEQHASDFKSLNPSQLVPVLIDGDIQLNQSLAIIDYLDETYPTALLTPLDKQKRYLVKAMAQDIAVDIHPLNNLRVLQYLTAELSLEESCKSDWYKHWILLGFEGLEQKLAKSRGTYCVGNEVSLVDICLIPQVYNAERFDVDLTGFPIIREVSAALRELSAFIDAAPENQPDAVIG
ncbi:maleylacetoacetate isomerase [Vibrio tetraodonis]|uniref:maleylacetoacetate isomerase n=1 Tax=Vibrio tetraodonis TaxID=2231647 RepID=UPI000E0A09BE|nr:maleylacetoacetate isomerase [Vibrio tetraodonis]